MSDNTTETIARECMAVRLRTINRAVSRIYDRALRPFGITVSQLNILVAISQFGQARQQDVCQVLSMERSTVSRDVVRMQKYGWIASKIGEDARTSVMKVTTIGKNVIEKAFPAWQSAQQRAVEILGKGQIQALDEAISALRAVDSS